MKVRNNIKYLTDSLMFPLNKRVLVEASAGTGKTYTIVELYIRLLLQIGENSFSKPLTVEQILVVTFTKAATRELQARIRDKIITLKSDIQHAIEHGAASLTPECVNKNLIAQIDNLELAKLRLNLAEQNMDMAAIYTIDGFCQQTLLRYAFNSGVNFNLELMPNIYPLQLKLIQQFWRENFYSLDLNNTAFIERNLISPANILDNLNDLLNKKNQIALTADYSYLTKLSLTEYLENEVSGFINLTNQIKQDWLVNQPEIDQLIAEAKQNKQLKPASYRDNNLLTRYSKIANWCAEEYNFTPPSELQKYFSFTTLNASVADKDTTNVFNLSIFHNIDKLAEYSDAVLKNGLLWYCFNWLNNKLSVYMQENNQHSFDNLLRLLEQALYAAQGDRLAELIREQYPFAMIDEFQDTDPIQYSIFKKIYLSQNSNQACGFTMIGDPKQSIYAFRGADIFAYLQAHKDADECYTLQRNWRSVPDIVNGINALFSSCSLNPFIYQDIQFTPVIAQKDRNDFLNNQNSEPAFVFYQQNAEANGDYKQDMVNACACSIQEYLAKAEQGQLTIEDKALAAKDIAVLVRSKDEANLVKQALLKLGIPAVFLSERRIVFDSDEAQELLYILMACLEPKQQSRLLTAISSKIFGLTAQDIHTIYQNENEWDRWVNRFIEYQKIWHYQGILPMLHKLLLNENIPQFLLSTENGQRRLTDILHLAELLQQNMQIDNSPISLVRWLERQINNGHDNQDQDEVQIRLETEHKQVQIVTIHKAKGLEYSVVWLPFIMTPQGNSRNKKLMLYHNPQQTNQLLWDLEASNENSQIYTDQEEQAEDLRLLYVALTRAKYQLIIGIPNQHAKPRFNGLKYLLENAAANNASQNPKLWIDNVFANKTDYIVKDINELQPIDWQLSTKFELDNLHIQEFEGKIENNWFLTSFTDLHRRNQFNNRQVKQNNEFNIGEYLQVKGGIDEQTELETQNKAQANSAKNKFNFPRGAQVGVILHSVLEQQDFTQDFEPATIAEVANKLQLDASWQPELSNWLKQILNTPISANGPSLNQIAKRDRLDELQFYLPIKTDLDLKKLNELLNQNSVLPEVTQLQFDSLKGMLSGFVDLIFRHKGKYYLVDYKSNYLGDNEANYQPKYLAQAMQEHRYDLQYLLYTLVLHRYLRMKDKNYDYERDFAGVGYLFLRGMNGENAATGVFFHKPDLSIIEQLDQLFGN